LSISSKVLEYTAQIQQLLDKINAEVAVGDFKTPTTETPKPKADLPPVEKAAPVKSELKLDWTKLDYLEYGMKITPKGYLPRDVFDNVNKLLFADGYRYSQPDRAWLFQPEEAGKSAPQKAAPTTTKGSKTVRISDINKDLKSPTIEGKLLDDPIQKDIDTTRGPTTVTNFRLDDGSGICRVSLWGELAESAMSLTAGVKVQITSLMVREPYDGMPQVSSGKWSKVNPL